MENYWNLDLYVDGDSLPGPLIIILLVRFPFLSVLPL